MCEIYLPPSKGQVEGQYAKSLSFTELGINPLRTVEDLWNASRDQSRLVSD